MMIPLQVITNHSRLTVKYHNLIGLKFEEQEIQLELLLNELKQKRFESDFLLEVSLVVLSQDKHVLLVYMPALIADAATLANFVREISDSYIACLHNRQLPDEPLQYVDLVEWQNELFEGEDAAIGREYWTTKKQAIAALANWQLNHEVLSEAKLEFEPKSLTLSISSEVVARLEAIAEKFDTSVAVLLQACWQILLWRITGKADIIIGTYSDGRNYEELAAVLGLFAKYIPVDSSLKENLKFSELLKQTSQIAEEAFQWQEFFTWEQVVESVESSLELSFFPICFEFKEQPVKYVTANVAFLIAQQYVCCDRFKIKLSCARRDKVLLVEFHYDSNVLKSKDIERWAGQFQTLLASVIDNPDAAIGELEILKPSDRQQLLVEFNNTQVDYPKDRCIHHLFEEQAARTPENIAVVYEDQQLTYAQLNTRANQLAHHLQALGVGTETVVALCLERSLDMLVGLLGILKAGGAYLPLDPLLPAERLAFMLQDAQVSLVISHSSLVTGGERLTEDKEQRPVICLDTGWEAIAKQSECNPTSNVQPENLVYVIYTSGSTGKPKGVAVEQQQLLNYLHGILEQLDLPEGSSFATVSTFAADLGNTAIFPALCTGGCLHIISQERATNAEAFAAYCRRHPIDCLKIVPSHLVALLNATCSKSILPRQCLILGGEAASWTLIEQIQQRNRDYRILNHYGPTETTVGVLTYPVESKPTHLNSETVPLGRPLANTQVYVLDQQLQPVPIGVPGELYIGGAGLARGYLNRPDLTAERFITNPFNNSKSQIPNPKSERLYKTGDLAQYLPDGNLEFLGRADNQVKLRGFRLELGEIEVVLSQHPQVWQAAVSVREDEPGNQQLVAYVVPDRTQPPSTSDLQSFLRQRLPVYMMPLAIAFLKALPLTPNGKVDRKSLPPVEGLRPEVQAAYVAPSNEVERTVATIWREMLHVEKVGIHDNFFELGGHSLLIIQLHSKLRETFNKNLSVSDLFQYPTVSSLAKYLRQEGNEPSYGTQSRNRAEIRRELMKQQMQARPKPR
jgi:amino acid adenylation domain-containing protein